MPDNDSLRVLVANASGQTAYSLLPLISKGEIFGHDQRITLILLDKKATQLTLEGVAMELVDCAFNLLQNIIVTSDIAIAFDKVDVAVLSDVNNGLSLSSFDIYHRYGEALEKFANGNVKVLVCGENSNTNSCIAKMFSPRIPNGNISCLSRTHQNCATATIARQLNTPVNRLSNIISWGSSSPSDAQFIDIRFAKLFTSNGHHVLISETIKNRHHLTNSTDAIIPSYRNMHYSAIPTANAISEHLHAIWFGTREGEWISMGVPSDGAYGVENGLFFSFPVTIGPDRIPRIVGDLPFDSFSMSMIKSATSQLIRDRDSTLQNFSSFKSNSHL